MRAAARTVRLGVVGLGMAGGSMVPVITSHARVRLAGAAEVNPTLRARFSADHAVGAVAELTELLRRDDIDAVYIATPHQFHREHAILAAQHGKHIVVEKPMALTLTDCDAMIAAAERHRVHIIVGHTHSFDPTVKAMRDLIAGGEMGRLAMISMWNFTDFLYRPRRPEELDTAQGGGILFNQLPHQVDVARFLAGSPVRSVRAMTGILDPSRRTEGCCSAFLDFENGAAATLVYSGYDHFDTDEMFGWVGSTGHPKSPRHGATRAALNALNGPAAELALRQDRYGYGAGARFQFDAPPHQAHFGTMVLSCERGDLRPTPDGLNVYRDEGLHHIALPPGQSGRTALLDELCNVILDSQAPIHTGLFARATLEVCLAIQQSAIERREIRLDGVSTG
jgi:phthalate 4,5-cis-dihydrodiol dehydrogenase